MRKLILIRTLIIWFLISVFLQVGFLFILNSHLKSNVQAATLKKTTPVIVQTVVNLPETGLSDLQASFDKHYMAYTDNQGLKVYDVKGKKQIFAVASPANGQILHYKWLPDRNILLYVVEKPNPYSRPAAIPKYATETVAKTPTEDPNQKPITSTTTVRKLVGYTQPYYNPQLTQLYSVDFGEGYDTANAAPTQRYESDIDIPPGGVIQGMEFSTFTNLIYMPVQTKYGDILYEIDVMRVITELQRPGEKIGNISASDTLGTLYVQSQLDGINQIITVKRHVRKQLLSGSQYMLLGQEDSKVMIGVMQNNVLTKVISMPDTGMDSPNPSQTTVEWQGNIPWQDYQVIAGTGDFLVFYNVHGAVVLHGGTIKNVTFTGEHNYLTSDGREVMEINEQANGTTLVKFQPL
ncbi:MAG: hypothetical protein M0Z55_08680 [Peptococcaceae bacterium]|nr:hypothetical protein [Peptococcaceae bacterium]